MKSIATIIVIALASISGMTTIPVADTGIEILQDNDVSEALIGYRSQRVTDLEVFSSHPVPNDVKRDIEAFSEAIKSARPRSTESLRISFNGRGALLTTRPWGDREFGVRIWADWRNADNYVDLSIEYFSASFVTDTLVVAPRLFLEDGETRVYYNDDGTTLIREIIDLVTGDRVALPCDRAEEFVFDRSGRWWAARDEAGLIYTGTLPENRRIEVGEPIFEGVPADHHMVFLGSRPILAMFNTDNQLVLLNVELQQTVITFEMNRRQELRPFGSDAAIGADYIVAVDDDNVASICELELHERELVGHLSPSGRYLTTAEVGAGLDRTITRRIRRASPEVEPEIELNTRAFIFERGWLAW